MNDNALGRTPVSEAVFLVALLAIWLGGFVALLAIWLGGFVLGTYWERRAERRDPHHAEAIASKDRRIRHLQKQVAVIAHQRNEVMEALRRERDRRAS